MTDNALTPELQKIVEQIRVLKDLTITTGFITSRSVGALLGKLSTEDLALVGAALREVRHE